MCIAIYKPVGEDIDYDTFVKCWESNPHGAGHIHINSEGKLDIFKTLDFDEWWEQYQIDLERCPTTDFVIHFRYATQGDIDMDNCHPFWIDSHHAFVHNGTVRNAPDDPDKKKSDTVMFNETILQNLPIDWLENFAIKELIEEYIGFSKLIVMNDWGEVEIFNAHKGEWVGNIWYSNDYYKKKRYTYKGNSSGYQYGGGYSYADYGETYWEAGEKYRWNYRICNRERFVFGKGWVEDEEYMSAHERKTQREKELEQAYKSKDTSGGDLIKVFRCDWCGKTKAESDLSVFRDSPPGATSCDEYIVLCSSCSKDIGTTTEDGYDEIEDADVESYVNGGWLLQ